MKELKAMSREELKYYLRRLSRAVEEVLPPGPSKRGKCDFALVLSDEPGTVYYACNSRRRITPALRTTVSRFERIQKRRLAKIR
jgi:hypothetical protein